MLVGSPHFRVLLGVSLLTSALSGTPVAAAILTRHVIVVVIDGARYTETFGDPALAQIPRIGNDFAAIAASVTRVPRATETPY